jgi:DNA-binding PadR family transcriptional regulator
MSSPEGVPEGRESDSERAATTSRMQDAVRLLLLVDGAAEDLPQPPLSQVPHGAVAVLRTQMALQALDFWLRNPDYFANWLLDLYDEHGGHTLLAEAQRIMDSEEPEIRNYPMLRYRFGAYEPLDEALSVLAAAGLVHRRREGSTGRTRQHNYYITGHGRQVVRELIAEVPELGYYVARVALLTRQTKGLSGSQLKAIQYQQQEYLETEWNQRIRPIVARVRQRIADVLAAAETTVEVR